MNVQGAMDKLEFSLGFSRDEAIRRVLERVTPWVEIETPSGHEANVLRLSERIEAEARGLSAEIDVFPAPGFGRNLRLTFEGREPQLEPVLAMGHIDTVHPIGTLARQPCSVEGDRCGGPGIYDMKTGVALVLEAVAVLRQRGTGPRRTLRMLVTCDEEIGSNSAKPLFRDSASGAYAALVPEPCIGDGSVKTRRKGVGTYRMEVTGRAAHAGIEPEKAVSAVAELADRIREVLGFANHARGSTINAGMIGGGTASNVVAASAWATIDTRFVEPDEGTRMDQAILAMTASRPGAGLAIDRGELRPPLVRTPGVVALFEHARQLAAELGVSLGEGLSGGGSDGSLVAAMGLPALDGLGPNGGGAHSVNEHILLSDLPFRLALMTRLLETL
jgi:glutamate carboxypeptidase